MIQGLRLIVLIVVMTASQSLFAQDKILLFRNFYFGQSADELQRLPGVKPAPVNPKIPAGSLIQEDKFLDQPAIIMFHMADQKLYQVSVTQIFSKSTYDRTIKALIEQGFAIALVQSPTKSYDLIANPNQDKQALLKGLSDAEAAGLSAKQMTAILINLKTAPKLLIDPPSTLGYLKKLPPSERVIELSISGSSISLSFYSPALAMALANRGPKERF